MGTVTSDGEFWQVTLGNASACAGHESTGVGHFNLMMKNNDDIVRRDVMAKITLNVAALINTPAAIGKTAVVRLRAPLIPA